MTSAPPADQTSEAISGRPCPRCGTRLRRGQDWCLACGAAATTRVAAPPTWRGPLVAMLGVLLVAVAALVIAFFALADDDASAPFAEQPPAAGEAPPAEDAPPAEQAVPDDEAGVGGQNQGAGQSPGDAPPESLAGWPEGQSAWTIILSRTSSRAAAERRARRFTEAGVPAGVLDTDGVSSLEPGAWIVFSGRYATAREAARAQQELGSAVPSSAYVRELAPG